MTEAASQLLPAAAAAGHRERLLLGMAAAIRERGGLRSVTVAEVVRHAQTSRRTFYQHFEDREQCFLALFDVMAEALLQTIAAAANDGGPFGDRVDRALAAYLGAVAAEPILSRAIIRETAAIVPAGMHRQRAMNERWARQIMHLIDDARAEDPTLRPLSFEAATIITGGYRDLVLSALEEGRDLVELQGVAGDVLRRIVLA